MEEGKIQGFLQAAKLVTSQDVVERGQGVARVYLWGSTWE